MFNPILNKKFQQNSALRDFILRFAFFFIKVLGCAWIEQNKLLLG